MIQSPWVIKVYFDTDIVNAWYSVYYKDDYVDSFTNHDDAVSWVIAHNNPQVTNGWGY
jgi:hypothetical protein